MNKFKKLILSLTITLLSSAGVEAMAKPIPQFKTFREFSTFVNKYSASDFLSNKKVFGDDKQGLLQFIYAAYEKLPDKSLAERLFQSKFKLTGWQIKDRVTAMISGGAIPQTLANAQDVIHNLSKEKSDLQDQIASLSAAVKDLRAGIAKTPATDTAGLQTLQAKLISAERKADDLNKIVEALRKDKTLLEKDISDLQAAGASAGQIKTLQDKLNETNTLLAAANKNNTDYQNQIKELRKLIKRMMKELPGSDVVKELKKLINNITNYYNSQVEKVNSIVLPDHFEVKSIDLVDLAKINTLNDIDTLQEILNVAEPIGNEFHNNYTAFNKDKDDLINKWNSLNINPKSVLVEIYNKGINIANEELKKIATKRDQIGALLQSAHERKEKRLDQEIDALAKSLPNEPKANNELAIAQALKTRTLDQLEIQATKQKLVHDNQIYKLGINQFTQLEAQAKNHANAENKLNNIKPILDLIKQTIDIEEEVVGHIIIDGGDHEPEGVSDVAVDLNNYSLSFKIGNVALKAENAQDAINKTFAERAEHIADESLIKAGQEVAKKVTQAELVGIWGSIMDGVYDQADDAQKTKIREFIKPIFAAYKYAGKGNKKAGAYKKGLKLYGLKNSQIIRSLVG